MTDIMELINDTIDNFVDAVIQQDIEKQQKAEDDLDIIQSHIQAMQEVCNLSIKWKKDPMQYYTELIRAIDKLKVLK